MNIIFRIFKKSGLAGLMILGDKLSCLLQHHFKLCGAIYYINAVKVTRKFVFGLFFLVLIAIITGSGFILLNIGIGAIIFNLTGNFKSMATYFVISGAVFVTLPVIIFLLINTERRWMRICRVDNIMRYIKEKG